MKKVFNIIFYIFYIISAAAVIFDITATSRAIAVLIHDGIQLNHVTEVLILEFCIPLIILSLIILTVINKNAVKPPPTVISLLLFVISFAWLIFVLSETNIYIETYIAKPNIINIPVLVVELISLAATVASLIPPVVIYGKALRKKAE